MARQSGFMKVTNGHWLASHKWLVIAIAALWIALASGVRFYGFDPANDAAAHNYRRQITRCWGSVARRYRCRYALDVANGRRVFLLWSMNLAIILGPPILLAAVYRANAQKAWRDAEEKRRRHSQELLGIHKPDL